MKTIQEGSVQAPNEMTKRPRKKYHGFRIEKVSLPEYGKDDLTGLQYMSDAELSQELEEKVPGFFSLLDCPEQPDNE